jgi:hypothetical protein
MTGLAMLRSVPMLGLMLKFQHGRPPANTCIRSESTATCGPGTAVRMLLHMSIVKAQPPRVMTFVHLAALPEPPCAENGRVRQFATQAESNSVSNVPSQLEQRPGRAGARWTVSDRPHMTQYRRIVVRTARRSAARCSAGASSASASSRWTPFLRSAFGTFCIVIMDG